MSQKTKRPKARTPKPHHAAFRLDNDCECGSEWGRHMIDLSDKEAEELPIYAVCARCLRRIDADA